MREVSREKSREENDMDSLSAGLAQPHQCPWWMQYFLVSPFRRILEPTDKLVGDCVKAGMTVLDPGCGFGYVSLALAQMVGPTGRVISVDIEPRAVQRLRRKARMAGIEDRLDARTCERRDLGLLADYSRQIDLVTVIHVLHEFEDIPGFLRQVAQLLRPDGRMLVVEPKGHIKPDSFAAEMECCRRLGFAELESSTRARGRMTALFRAPIQ